MLASGKIADIVKIKAQSVQGISVTRTDTKVYPSYMYIAMYKSTLLFHVKHTAIHSSARMNETYRLTSRAQLIVVVLSMGCAGPDGFIVDTLTSSNGSKSAATQLQNLIMSL